MISFRRAVLALVAVLSLLAPGAASAQALPARFLVVADIHFNPMDDPKLVDRLAVEAIEHWPEILESGADDPLARAGRDPGWPLVRAALDAMRAAEPHPAFILALGDFLAHRFRKQFEATATRHGEADYRAFVRKTIAFVAQEARRRFPTTAILPALGNNDNDCADYAMQPNGPFLADTLPVMHDLLGALAGPDFDADWRATGNYVAPIRKGLRVVVADTVFFARNYRDACSKVFSDPAAATLEWLDQQLSAAERAGDKVWLAFHIPPGMDTYATLHGGGCPEALVTMWRGDVTAAFEAMLHRYAETVLASFGGHTHMDEFRLIGPPDSQDGFTLVTPAVSPIYYQNPAFQRLAYTADFRLLSRETHYLPDLAAAAEWRTGPGYAGLWDPPFIDLRSLTALDRLIAGDKAARARWMSVFSANAPGMWLKETGSATLSDATFRAYHCTEHTTNLGAFEQCYCNPDAK